MESGRVVLGSRGRLKNSEDKQHMFQNIRHIGTILLIPSNIFCIVLDIVITHRTALP